MTEEDFIQAYCKTRGAKPSVIRIIERYQTPNGGMAFAILHGKCGCLFVSMSGIRLVVEWTAIITTSEIGARTVAQHIAYIIGATQQC